MIGLRKWIIGVLVLAIIGGVYWRISSRTHVLGEAYVADQSVTLWSTLAQVRQRAGEAHWGDQVEILKRSSGDTLVRTPAGVEGWMDGHALIDSAAWQREVHLQSAAHAIPIQATGHTKVFTNLRLEAGRDATRIYQLTGGVPLAIVSRAAVEVPGAPNAPANGSGVAPPAKSAGTKRNASNHEDPKRESPKYEEWLLIYPLPARLAAASVAAPVVNSGANSPASRSSAGQPSQASPSQQSSPGGTQDSPDAAPSDSANAPTPSQSPTQSSSQANQGDMVMGRDPAQRQSAAAGAQKIPPLAGWVLARFVELDLPETLHDYATSAGMRPVAWFVLNYASSDESGPKPQYLMAGNHNGGEGQSCDFNSLRVYTWGPARHRYETAYVEGNLCGYFPIRAGKQAHTGDPEFRFTALESNGARLERVYAMHQTTVRRNHDAESQKSPAPAKSLKPAVTKPKRK